MRLFVVVDAPALVVADAAEEEDADPAAAVSAVLATEEELLMLVSVVFVKTASSPLVAVRRHPGTRDSHYDGPKKEVADSSYTSRLH